jgi:uncharacterized membrane protein YphA (DoxX/SURF4 family)
VVAIVAAILVGAAFVLAGAAKLAMGGRWPAQAKEFGVPWQLAQFVPWWELVVGALLAAQVARPITAWIAAGTLVLFSASIAAQLARGKHPPCACFGAWSPKPVGARTLARNAVLIAIAVVAGLA